MEDTPAEVYIKTSEHSYVRIYIVYKAICMLLIHAVNKCFDSAQVFRRATHDWLR